LWNCPRKGRKIFWDRYRKNVYDPS
jgi:hypothetical protein